MGFYFDLPLIGRLQKEEALKVRVSKADEANEREKVMCFTRKASFSFIILKSTSYSNTINILQEDFSSDSAISLLQKSHCLVSYSSS